MDIATIIGIILGLGSILGGIVLMTPDLGMFGSVSSFAIVFGGMIASVSVAFPLQEVLKLGSAMGAVFKGSKEKLGDEVDGAVEVSEIARKGVAELESKTSSIDNPFFRDGVQMVIDGMAIEELTDILATRIDYRESRERTQADLFKNMGVMSPAWGMIGTLIGLEVMLSGFGEGGTDTLGAGMSAALITTFYGAVFANLFFLPMSAKILTRVAFHSTQQALYLEAVRLIHQKKHPIIVREKLNSFIPPKEWKREE